MQCIGSFTGVISNLKQYQRNATERPNRTPPKVPQFKTVHEERATRYSDVNIFLVDITARERSSVKSSNFRDPDAPILARTGMQDLSQKHSFILVGEQ